MSYRYVPQCTRCFGAAVADGLCGHHLRMRDRDAGKQPEPTAAEVAAALVEIERASANPESEGSA